jgi:Kef-type K+ transport system membrane component KefB
LLAFLIFERHGQQGASSISFLVQSLIIIVSVLVAGQVSRRLGQPSVMGQLLVGVLLGPALLGWITPSPLITELAEIGVILLMFLAGLETNVKEIRRSAMAATLVAVGGMALPFAGGWATARLTGYPGSTAIFIGVALMATSVSIAVQTLRELGHLRGRPGVTILAAAVLDDVLGIVVLALVLGLLGGQGMNGGSLPLLLGKMVLFFLAAGLLGWLLLPRLLHWVSRFEAGTAVLGMGIAIAMGFAYAAELAGLAGIIGAYLAGLVLSSAEIRHRLMREVEHTAFAWFVPFFYVSVGLTAKFSGISGPFLGFLLVLIVVAVLTKLIGAGLGARLAGFPTRTALGIGAGMIARGEVGLIIASIGMAKGLISQQVYTGVVVLCLVTTLVTPPLLKIFFPKRMLATDGATPVD